MDKNSYDDKYKSTLNALKNFENELLDDSYITESNNYATTIIYLRARSTMFSATYSIVISEYTRLLNLADKEVSKLLEKINSQNLNKVTVNTVSNINTLEDALFTINKASLELKKVSTSTLLFNNDLKQYVPSLTKLSPNSFNSFRNKLLGKSTDIKITNLNKFKTYLKYLFKSLDPIKDIKFQYKNILNNLENKIDTDSSISDSEYKTQINIVTQYFSRNIDIIIRISIDIINTIITVLRNIIDSNNKHRINEVN